MSNNSGSTRGVSNFFEDIFHGLREIGILLIALAPLDGAIEGKLPLSSAVTDPMIVSFLWTGAGFYALGSLGELVFLWSRRVTPKPWVDKWIRQGGPKMPVLHTMLVTAVVVTICAILFAHLHTLWSTYYIEKAKAAAKPAEQKVEGQEAKGKSVDQKLEGTHVNPAGAAEPVSALSEFMKESPEVSREAASLMNQIEKARMLVRFAADQNAQRREIDDVIRILQVVRNQQDNEGEKGREGNNVLGKAV